MGGARIASSGPSSLISGDGIVESIMARKETLLPCYWSQNSMEWLTGAGSISHISDPCGRKVSMLRNCSRQPGA
jgi:hypothetical protein